MYKYLVAVVCFFITISFAQPSQADCPEATSAPFFIGQKGVIFRDVDLRDTFIDFAKVADFYQRLNETLKSQGITLVIALVPTKGVVNADYLDLNYPRQSGFDLEAASSAYYHYVESLNALGVVTVDLLTPLKTANWEELGQFPNMAQETHWSTLGAKISAEAVARK